MSKIQIPAIDTAGGKSKLILITGLFAFVFINVFEPFDIYAGPHGNDFITFLEISIALLGVLGTLAFSQFVLRRLFRLDTMTVFTLLPWFLLEALLIGLVWAVMTTLIDAPAENLFVLAGSNMVECIFLIALPYFGAVAYLNYRHRMRTLQAAEGEQDPNPLVAFREKSGKEKLSVRRMDILFLESSDNYVLVHYLENGAPQQYTLRNTLKNLETTLLPLGIVRCHRSFLVNVQNVQRKEKSAKDYRLYLQQYDGPPVPVSKSYTSEMDKLLGPS